jgi:hypothetical protein
VRREFTVLVVSKGIFEDDLFTGDKVIVGVGLEGGGA